MKDSTKFWLSCTPFLLMGLAVVLSPFFKEFMARRQEEAWKTDSLTKEIIVKAPTEASSTYAAASTGNHMVFETALLRLVMPAKGSKGGLGSDGTIATAHKSGGGGGGSSNGPYIASEKAIAYGSQHEFSGPGYHFKFDIRQGCFCNENQRVCIVDTPKLIVLNADGTIKSATEINISYPRLRGTPADIVALVARAQKYAAVPPEDFAEEEWRQNPMTTLLEVKSATEASSARFTEENAKGLVFETALLRLVIPATQPYNGSIASARGPASIASTQVLSEVAKSEKWLIALRDYETRRLGCSTRYTILGPDHEYNFDIMQGCLCINGQRVCIVDTPKLVILNSDGSIKSVRELTVTYPKPSGSPADLQALTQTARKFAEPFQP